jgi:hypothetical protein
MMRFLLPLVAAISLLTGSAGAEELQDGTKHVRSFEAGNALLAECTQASSEWQSYCIGYVSGIADVMGMALPVEGFLACIPMPVSTSQARDVAVNYLQKHPEGRNFAAAYLVAAALAEAFPCSPAAALR